MRRLALLALPISSCFLLLDFQHRLVCGDGILTPPEEECEDGNTEDAVAFSDPDNAGLDICNKNCTIPRCGNGILEPFATQDKNGDGLVDAQDGVEECDNGAANSDTAPDACRSDCTLPRCGDGAADTNEQCDDGNAEETDGCLSTCLSATCGDTFVQASVEQCDDGNTNDSDACVAGCFNAACGDTFVQTGVEQCDDGNTTDADGCEANCASPACQNNIVDPGEICLTTQTTIDAGSFGTFFAVGDLDNDSHLDFAVPAGTAVNFYFGSGTGIFFKQSSAATGTISAVATGDVDGDNDLDVFLVNSGISPNVQLLVNNGSRSFSAPVSIGTLTAGAKDIVTADFNPTATNKFLDVAVTTNANITIFTGDGTGIFTASTNTLVTAGTVLEASDLNNDTFADLAVVKPNTGVSILFSNGDVTPLFSAQPIANTTAAVDVVFIDVDDDNDLDIAITNGTSLSTGINVAGNFAAGPSFAGSITLKSLTALDIDLDGKQEIAVSGGSKLLGFSFNNGTPVARDVSTASVNFLSLHSGNFNEDNLQDVIGVTATQVQLTLGTP